MNEIYALLNRGQWKKAARAARALLEKEPRHAQALHALGLAALQQGDAVEACIWLTRAVAQQPERADYPLHLGVALQAKGDWTGAATAFEAALKLDGALVPAWLGLGEAQYAQGQKEAAAETFARAIALQPGQALAHFNLANIQRELGQTAAAVASYQQAIHLAPDDADAPANLGALYQEQGENERALPYLRAAIHLQPRHAPAYIALGRVLWARNEPRAAEEALRAGMKLNPQDAAGWFLLCELLFKHGDYKGAEDAAKAGLDLQPDDLAGWEARYEIAQKRGAFDAAEQAARECLRIAPEDCKGWVKLASALEKNLDFAGAEEAARRALARPDCFRGALSTLLAVKSAQNRFAEAEAILQQLIESDPTDVLSYETWLFQSNYRPDVTPQQAKAFALRFAECAREQARPYTFWQCEPTVGRPLRIGLVSGDFQRHPVGYLLLKPLYEIDPNRFQLFFYSNDDYEDDLTARFKGIAAQWREVSKLDDAALAKQIHDDAIDILIDLAGVTAKNRLPVFVWKPAPVQVTWLGYFGTTGLREIDWILADHRVLPAEEEANFVEQAWRMPDSYFCYTPPGDDLPVATLPAQADGRVTFGCFNGYHKLNEGVLARWARILRELPDSRLYLKNKSLSNAEVRAELAAKLSAWGVAPDRLRLEGISSHGQYMRAYHEVDIALDPFPFPGGITTIEGLWMGVPVVTLKSPRYIGHQGETILRSVGLPDWIAEDEEAYIAKAVEKAANLGALAELRAAMREQVRHSALCDATRFARNLEIAWRGMWGKWCESANPSKPV